MCTSIKQIMDLKKKKNKVQVSIGLFDQYIEIKKIIYRTAYYSFYY